MRMKLFEIKDKVLWSDSAATSTVKNEALRIIHIGSLHGHRQMISSIDVKKSKWFTRALGRHTTMKSPVPMPVANNSGRPPPPSGICVLFKRWFHPYLITSWRRAFTRCIIRFDDDFTVSQTLYKVLQLQPRPLDHSQHANISTICTVYICFDSGVVMDIFQLDRKHRIVFWLLVYFLVVT